MRWPRPSAITRGAVIGSVSVSGPAYRLDQSRMAALAPALVAAAARISDRLGYHG